jgi:hypothetical protein
VRHLGAQDADSDVIGAVAVDALDEIHRAIYGEAPQASRSWTDGDAILLVVRLSNGCAPASVMAIQRMVSAAVHRRTSVTLRSGGVNVDPTRGLAVLAFERSRIPESSGEPIPIGPLHDAG